jgi:hypothetical protein
LEISVAVTAQLLPHFVSPDAQLEEHFFCEQTWSPLQAVPHVPQFMPSDATLTQLDPHAVRSALHAQLPAVQL